MSDIRTLGCIYGLPLMKFTLTYDGELPAASAGNSRKKEKWEIRKQLDRQLRELWDSSPNLRDREELRQPISIGPRTFLPLVRENLLLKCGLQIKFLRKEEPGQLIYQGGDIDNRLKTLFDALAVPNVDQLMADPTSTDPIYCLLEDDRLITSIAVNTEKLLSRPGASKHEVRLVIDVDVRVIRSISGNLAFLGDGA